MDPPLRLGPCIGVFDSGIGGLSVLRELRRTLAEARLLYVADSGHAPYGERSDAAIVARARHIAGHLRAAGAELLVIACNTATAAAVQALRDADPALPVVGIEPGLKPAIVRTRNGRIGVMATTATLASAGFGRLLQRHAAGSALTLQSCTGLADAIEAGPLDSPLIARRIAQHTQPLRAADCDVVVLGCTHYALVAPAIQAALGPQVVLIDTAAAVARHTATRAAALPRRSSAGLAMWSSGDAQALADFAARWLGMRVRVAALP